MQTETVNNGSSINGIKMNFNLNSLTYGPIVFQSEVPLPFGKLVVPGSRSHWAEGDYGYILFQEINAGGIIIFYNSFVIKEDLALDFNLAQPVLQTHIALKNENRYDINGLGPVHLKQGQLNMIRSSMLQGTFYLEHNNEYKTFNIYYPVDQLKDLVPFFPPLKEFTNGIDLISPLLLFQNHRWVNLQMLDIIDRLLHCPYKNGLKDLYFDWKVKELLLLLLTRECPDSVTQSGLNKRTIEAIYEARFIIETRFSDHITMQEIAKQVGMNEVKLKTGFKSLFGMGMFEYLLKTRMQKAKTWLLESDKPIKAIAKLTGYGTKQSFLTAFKNYFDDTPGAFRKN